MKKLLLAVLVCVAFVTVSNAQVAVRAGVNFANLSSEQNGTSVDLSSNIGLQLGLTYEMAVGETLAFRPGVLFSMKGAKIEVSDNDIKTKLNYLEIPLDLVYKAGMLDIHAGPYLGFLMSAKNEDDDIKDGTESLDFGLNVGGQYNINAMLGVGVNYGLGLANLIKDAPDNTSSKNRNLSVYLTYAF